MGCGVSKDVQLYEAVKCGNVQVVHKLIKAGVPIITEVDTVGSTLLHVAGQLGHAGVIEEICEVSSKEFIYKKNEHEFTALHEAAVNGHAKAIRTLVEGGLDPNTPGPRMNSALHLAVSKGHDTVIKALVFLGADVECKGHQEERPLHVAARKGNRAVCKMLLELGADPAATDLVGRMPCQVAKVESEEEDGAGAGLTGAEGQTAEDGTATAGSTAAGRAHSEGNKVTPLSFDLRPENVRSKFLGEADTRIVQWQHDHTDITLLQLPQVPPAPTPIKESSRSPPSPSNITTVFIKDGGENSKIQMWWASDPGATCIHIRCVNGAAACIAAFFLNAHNVAVVQVQVHSTAAFLPPHDPAPPFEPRSIDDRIVEEDDYLGESMASTMFDQSRRQVLSPTPSHLPPLDATPSSPMLDVQCKSSDPLLGRIDPLNQSHSKLIPIGLDPMGSRLSVNSVSNVSNSLNSLNSPGTLPSAFSCTLSVVTGDSGIPVPKVDYGFICTGIANGLVGREPPVRLQTMQSVDFRGQSSEYPTEPNIQEVS